MRNMFKTIPIVVFCASSALNMAAAFAADDDQDQIEEVIVSATYRDTRLMDTPLTISAVTAEDIQLKGIEDIQTLYQSIPGLSYRTNSQTYNTLSIRGLTPPAGGGSATVGVYMDSMPITDSNNGGLRQTMGALFDMERVEVLKGPQGTLYGEGSMGGNLRYITNKPDPTDFSWAFKAGGESNDESSGVSTRVDGMLNIPLGEQLALRAVGYLRDRKGILDQVAPRSKKDVDTREDTGGRLTLAWFPSDTFEVSFMANFIDGDMGGPGLGFHCFSIGTPSDPAGQVPRYDLPNHVCEGETDQFDKRDPYVTMLAHPTHTSGGFDEQDMYNLTAKWDLDFGATLSFSVSRFERFTRYSEETSPRFAAGLNAIVDGGCFGAVAACGPDVISGLGGDGSFTAAAERDVYEVRLLSDTDSAWQWTVGAYVKDGDNYTGTHDGCTMGGGPVYRDPSITNCWLQYSFLDGVSVADQVTIVTFLNGVVPGNRSYRAFGERALFGELSYSFSDQWELLVGVRYADVNFDLDVARPGVDSKADPVTSLKNDTTSTSPKVTLTWRPMEDWMVYGTFSHGFRPGIINSALATRIAQLEPLRATDPIADGHYERLVDRQLVDGDEMLNFELGVKATVLDGRLSFTSALYSAEWEDTIIATRDEISDVVGVTPFAYNYNINSGNAESQGLEWELRTSLTDALTFSAGGDFNWKAKINSAGQGRYLGVEIAAGNRLANAPKHSGYFSLVYDFDLYGFAASARADGYSVAESWNTANNERPAPSYQTVDLKLSLRRDNWMVSAYLRNVTDEVIVYEFNQVGYRYGRPRSFGVELSYTP
ncbi:MAG: TonB-dependent receptor [SAR202 cluster bacterium]|nr:TonB-dependent receptor [SAR202 cluster bacterium]HJN51646.1 TonB-dependent receptor [Pseudomonadales bacterium]